jgi:hypothetical protein
LYPVRGVDEEGAALGRFCDKVCLKVGAHLIDPIAARVGDRGVQCLPQRRELDCVVDPAALAL